MSGNRHDPKDQLRMLEDAFPELVRKPDIHWRDIAGGVHRCRMAVTEAEEPPLVWTDCKYDVPPGEAYEMEPGDPFEPITCPLCLSGEEWGGAVAERLGMPPPKPREP